MLVYHHPVKTVVNVVCRRQIAHLQHVHSVVNVHLMLLVIGKFEESYWTLLY